MSISLGTLKNLLPSDSSLIPSIPSYNGQGGQDVTTGLNNPAFISMKVGPLRIISGTLNVAISGGHFSINVSPTDFNINKIQISQNTEQFFQSQYMAATLNSWGGNPNPVAVPSMPYINENTNRLIIPLYAYGTQPGGNNFSLIFTIIGFA